MMNIRYQPAKHAPLHTPSAEKLAAAECMSADVQAYIEAGGTISKVTREAYRQANIEREARRDRRTAMEESLHRIAFHEEASFDSPMQEQAAARMGLVDKTQGVFASVDGIEADLYEGDPRQGSEVDFFRADDEPTDDEGLGEDDE
jgi:hypothetical protein